MIGQNSFPLKEAKKNFKGLNLQPVASQGVKTDRGVYLLSRVMARVEACLGKALGGRLHDIEKGTDDWNVWRDRYFNNATAQNRPSFDNVLRGMAYSALEKILLNEGRILVKRGAEYHDISSFADDLFFNGDALITPCTLRSMELFGGGEVFEEEVISIAARNASIYAEAAFESSTLPMFDVSTWSVRQELLVLAVGDADEVASLQERWRALQTMAGMPLCYQSDRTYDGRYGNSPAQIEHSIRNQLECMVDGRLPKLRSSLGRHLFNEVLATRKMWFPDERTVPYGWLAKYFWNNADLKTHGSLRPYKRELDCFLSQ